MRRSGQLLFAFLPLLTACDSQLAVLQSSLTRARVLEVSKVEVSEGDEIQIKGTYFNDKVTLFVNDEPVALEILSSSQAKFYTPPLSEASVQYAVFKQDNKVIGKFGLLNKNTSASEQPKISSKDLCTDTVIVQEDGTALRGLRDCSSQIDDCTLDGQIGCRTKEGYVSAATEGLSSKILQGQIVAGIEGTGRGRPLDCASDGATNCVAVTGYPAADTANAEVKILVGQSLAGVSGTAEAKPANCTADGEVACVTDGTLFKAASLTQAIAANIKSGVTIAGVAGSAITESHVNCAADGASGCIADGTNYLAASTATAVAGNIKSGVTLAGVTGVYPNAANPLNVSDGFNDLDTATFNAKIKASTSFGWFDRNGTRYSTTGSTDITSSKIASGATIFGTSGSVPVTDCSSDGQSSCVATSTFPAADISNVTTYDIRAGKTLGGVAGALNFYKNSAKLSARNRTTGDGASASGTVADVYDTTEDSLNNTDYLAINTPPGWAAGPGPWIRDSASDTGVGGGTALNSICDGTEDCVYKDVTTGIFWARAGSSQTTMEAAITACETLAYGGYSDWRLPTQKELMQTYVNGIVSLSAATKLNLPYAGAYRSSTWDGSTGNFFVVQLNNGLVARTLSTTNAYYLCARP